MKENYITNILNLMLMIHNIVKHYSYVSSWLSWNYPNTSYFDVVYWWARAMFGMYNWKLSLITIELSLLHAIHAWISLPQASIFNRAADSFLAYRWNWRPCFRIISPRGAVRLHPDFNPHPFGHCVIFSGKKVTDPPSPKVPARLCSTPLWVRGSV